MVLWVSRGWSLGKLVEINDWSRQPQLTLSALPGVGNSLECPREQGRIGKTLPPHQPPTSLFLSWRQPYHASAPIFGASFSSLPAEESRLNRSHHFTGVGSTGVDALQGDGSFHLGSVMQKHLSIPTMPPSPAHTHILGCLGFPYNRPYLHS